MALLAIFTLFMCGGCSEDTTGPIQSVNTSDPKYVKCWVHVSHGGNDPDFKNPFDQIKGPISLSNLRDVKGTRHSDWSGRVDSLGAGPAANVTIWSDEDFQGKSRKIEPSEKIEDVKAAGFSSVGSLKIEYVPGS